MKAYHYFKNLRNLLLVAGLFLTSTVAAQNTFDFSTEKIAPNYKGDTVWKMYEAIEKNDTESKIFTTALNYQLATFNPDTKTWSARVVFSEAGGKIFVGLQNTESKEKYLASNVFGATVEVNKYESVNHRLALANEDIPNLLPVEDIVLIDADLERRINTDLRTLLIFKLVPPFKESAREKTTPTLTSPLENDNLKSAVYGKLLGVWLFDNKTGKVVHKYKVNNSKQ